MEISRRLQKDSRYVQMFADSFGSSEPVNTQNGVKAIATFVRTVISGHSRYDSYIGGDSTALSAEEISGLKLFSSERTRCSVCHSGFNFTDNDFHNTALTLEYFDKGRYFVTHKSTDFARFKTPTLRNIALTAPYMHDGSKRTLEEVIEHYNSGGVNNFNKDTLIRPLNLTIQEKSDLIAFLNSLTDENLLKNPAFSKP